MANPSGTPIWYELMTDAPDATEVFYGSVLGLTFEKPPGGMERDYLVASAPDGNGVGGILKRPAGAPFAPIWAVYFGVDDVDASTEKLQSLGGSVHIDPTDIPGVGRFAFVADPQGALFYLMKGLSDEDSTAFAPDKVGHCSWNELVTNDQTAALEFYSALLGFEKVGVMPMGEMGDYTFIAAAGKRIGAMMNGRDLQNGPFWNFAFTVADIDAAKSAVEAGGGTINLGPLELPGDSGWLIQTSDPQGAKVMFSGPRK